MPRKNGTPKLTHEQEKQKYRKEKEHIEAERRRRAAARVAEARAETAPRRVGLGGTGRPFGTTGGYLKPWAKRILAYIYTDTMFLRDFLLLKPKDRLQFLTDLDPKNFGQGTPEEVAARIKATLDAIQQTVPDPHEGKTKEVKKHGYDQS